MKKIVAKGKNIALMGLLVLLFACSGGNENSQPGEVAAESNATATIGVSVLTVTHPFFLDLIDELKKEAAAQNIEVIINSGEFDIAKQKNQISDFIVKQVDAIIVCPTDSKAIGTAIQEANQAGIPVFSADIAVLADDVDVVAHVGIDNYSGGKIAGEVALELLGDEGQIAIIDHPEVESVIQRTKGFMEVINKAIEENNNISVVARLPGSGSMDKAFKAAEDILLAHPEVDVIFGINDETALGAVAAIEKAGKNGSVHVIGFGGKEEALKAVREGSLYADIITHPRQIGAQAIQSVVKYMQGETIEKEILIPTQLYDPDAL